MNNFVEKFGPKLNKAVISFSNNIFVRTIASGMARLLPVTIIGSIITLITSIPIDAYTAWLKASGLRDILTLGSTMSNDLITIYLIISLSAELAKNYKKNQITAICISLLAFFIVTPLTTFDVEGKKVLAFTLQNLGSRGMFVGIFVSLFVTWFYAFLLDKGLKIKMHPSVPPAIAGSFEALVPSIIIALMFIGINWGFSHTAFGDIHSFIYKILQGPLESAGSSLPALLVILFLAELFWWFGIHGSNVTGAVTSTVYMPLAIANAEALAAGAMMPFILNSYFINIFKGPRHLALALMLLLLPRSKQLKAIGKVAIIPGIFGISEPMKFGLPMVFNPVIFLPMTLAPVICVSIAYFATAVGFMSPVGINLPWSMPPFISGFLATGWQGAAVQIVQFLAVIALYFPFLKMMDKQKCAEEAALEAEGTVIEEPAE